VGVVGEQASAHAPNESAVAFEDRGEGRFVPRTGEACEQLPIVYLIQSPFRGQVPGKVDKQVQDRGPHTRYVPAARGFMQQRQEKTSQLRLRPSPSSLRRVSHERIGPPDWNRFSTPHRAPTPPIQSPAARKPKSPARVGPTQVR